MPAPVHRNEQTGNAVLDRIQSNVRQLVHAFGSLLATVPFLSRGKLVTVTFAAGVAQTVQHNLGKKCRGYIVVRNYGTNVSNVFGETGAVATDPLNQIVLITSVASKFDVWFFA